MRWLLAFLPAIAFADAGTLRLTQTSGPFAISVFSGPLRVGRAEVSVLVQREGVLLLDAIVELHLRAPDGTAQTRLASHDDSSNRLLQAALVDLPVSGSWQLSVEIRHGSDTAMVSCELPVESATLRPYAQWPALALPPLGILLFVLRERRRQASR